MKILFLGAGFRNKGSAAMLISTMECLRGLIPDCEFVLASNFPEFDKPRADKYLLKAFVYRLSLKNVLRMFGSLFSLISEVATTDLVLDLSGFIFTNRQRITRGLAILVCRLFQKPVVLYSQSLGPFKSKTERMLGRVFLSLANAIIVRGKTSRNYLSRLGITQNVFVHADSAFLLEPASQERLHEILVKEGLERINETPTVGIAVNTRIYERTEGRQIDNRYVNFMALLSDFLVEDFNADIVFIPYETTFSEEDDRSVARMTFAKTIHKKRIYLIETEYEPDELKALTSIFSLFVGCRFHSVVASTSMCVPTIAVGWSHKYFELMQTLGQSRYICNYKDLSLDRLAHLAREILHRKAEVQKELRSEVEKAKSSAIKSAELVAEMLPLHKSRKAS